MMKIGFISCFDHINFGAFEEFGFENSISFLDFDILLWDIGYLHYGYRGEVGFRKLFEDREKRLNELQFFLNSGKTLVVLLSEINDLKQRISSKGFSEFRNILNEKGLAQNTVDTFSFLPAGLERIVRNNVVESRGKRIDFRGDKAFFPAWEILYDVAWYDAYFTRPVGTPFLFINGTQLPVGTWIPYLNGNVFFIPANEHDSNDDYPKFVEAAKRLKLGSENLSGDLIEVSWQSIEVSPVKAMPIEITAPLSNFPRANPNRSRENLRRKIVRLFNDSEIRDLCYDLKIKYDDVSLLGGRMSDTVRELLLFCERKSMLDKLITWCSKERPHEDWSEFI